MDKLKARETSLLKGIQLFYTETLEAIERFTQREFEFEALVLRLKQLITSFNWHQQIDDTFDYTNYIVPKSKRSVIVNSLIEHSAIKPTSIVSFQRHEQVPGLLSNNPVLESELGPQIGQNESRMSESYEQFGIESVKIKQRSYTIENNMGLLYRSNNLVVNPAEGTDTPTIEAKRKQRELALEAKKLITDIRAKGREQEYRRIIPPLHMELRDRNVGNANAAQHGLVERILRVQEHNKEALIISNMELRDEINRLKEQIDEYNRKLKSSNANSD